MHIAPILAGIAILAGTAASTASADYYLKIEGVGRDSPSGPIYLKVQSTGDLDGDGTPDSAVIKIVCGSSGLASSHYTVTSPRDAASGMASGKRTHKPVTFVKEWGPASPQLRAMKPTYDVKKVEGTGARAASDEDGWSPISLGNVEGLCQATAKAVKTRSNIQNN